jgi:hypothetical protein
MKAAQARIAPVRRKLIRAIAAYLAADRRQGPPSLANIGGLIGNICSPLKPTLSASRQNGEQETEKFYHAAKQLGDSVNRTNPDEAVDAHRC